MSGGILFLLIVAGVLVLPYLLLVLKVILAALYSIFDSIFNSGNFMDIQSKNGLSAVFSWFYLLFLVFLGVSKGSQAASNATLIALNPADAGCNVYMSHINYPC